MNTIEKFKEAALLLQQEPVYKELKDAKDANDTDQELQKMITDYTNLRLALDQAIQNNESIVELDAEATKLYGNIMAYPGIVRYHKAKAAAEQFIAFLGNIITTAMNGEDPSNLQPEQPKQENCTGHCSSCAGCSSENSKND